MLLGLSKASFSPWVQENMKEKQLFDVVFFILLRRRYYIRFSCSNIILSGVCSFLHCLVVVIELLFSQLCCHLVSSVVSVKFLANVVLLSFRHTSMCLPLHRKKL